MRCIGGKKRTGRMKMVLRLLLWGGYTESLCGERPPQPNQPLLLLINPRQRTLNRRQLLLVTQQTRKIQPPKPAENTNLPVRVHGRRDGAVVEEEFVVHIPWLTYCRRGRG